MGIAMTTILHVDSSARVGESGRQPHGSHTRRLTRHFLDRWLAHDPDTLVISRDVAAVPPSPVDGRWIHAAFTRPEAREGWMRQMLQESDLLIEEIEAADLILIGAPMYNFGIPSNLKAWIDNIVRVGRTFGFDRSRQGDPYWPLLAGMDKQLVVLGSRGDHGYDAGGRIAAMNHVEPSIRTAFGYIGITRMHAVAAEIG